ncbi:unnamed protein product [Cochlearia groenlandica]
MKRSYQLSIVLIIFTILVLGCDAQKKQKQCTEVIKEDGCVHEECQTMCLEKRTKAGSICTNSGPGAKGPKKCVCFYHCP